MDKGLYTLYLYIFIIKEKKGLKVICFTYKDKLFSTYPSPHYHSDCGVISNGFKSDIQTLREAVLQVGGILL